eukprot:TRINITY_DN431_c0_g1_i4.p1 TRINITY_DN431_c0_g1~~TRINITY_DN431_c0_g1_i4.p1  ORF type:complete len:143 (-),score=15.69 TRINITY_DN431_c0_g1_i4:182-610(-)
MLELSVDMEVDVVASHLQREHGRAGDVFENPGAAGDGQLIVLQGLVPVAAVVVQHQGLVGDERGGRGVEEHSGASECDIGTGVRSVGEEGEADESKGKRNSAGHGSDSRGMGAKLLLLLLLNERCSGTLDLPFLVRSSRTFQ